MRAGLGRLWIAVLVNPADKPAVHRKHDAGRCTGAQPTRAPGPAEQSSARTQLRVLPPGLPLSRVVLAEPLAVGADLRGTGVAAVPWARHGAGHTRFFDDQVAWLAVTCSKSAVMALMRIAWRTVGAIITRVAADATAGVDQLAGLRRIGIDEISYKRNHRYLTTP